MVEKKVIKKEIRPRRFQQHLGRDRLSRKKGPSSNSAGSMFAKTDGPWGVSELVVLASGNITLIDIVVHVNEKVLVGAVEERHSTGCDITIESSQSPENHVVVHEQSIQFHDELNAMP